MPHRVSQATSYDTTWQHANSSDPTSLFFRAMVDLAAGGVDSTQHARARERERERRQLAAHARERESSSLLSSLFEK